MPVAETIAIAIEVASTVKTIKSFFDQENDLTNQITDRLDQIDERLIEISAKLDEINLNISNLRGYIDDKFDTLYSKEVYDGISIISAKLTLNEIDSELIAATTSLMRWFITEFNNIKTYFPLAYVYLRIAIKAISKLDINVYSREVKPLIEGLSDTLRVESGSLLEVSQVYKSKALSQIDYKMSVMNSKTNEMKKLIIDARYENDELVLITNSTRNFIDNPGRIHPKGVPHYGRAVQRKHKTVNSAKAEIREKIINNVENAQKYYLGCTAFEQFANNIGKLVD